MSPEQPLSQGLSTLWSRPQGLATLWTGPQGSSTLWPHLQGLSTLWPCPQGLSTLASGAQGSSTLWPCPQGLSTLGSRPQGPPTLWSGWDTGVPRACFCSVPDETHSGQMRRWGLSSVGEFPPHGTHSQPQVLLCGLKR